MSIILATWKAAIKRIKVWGNPGKYVRKTPSQSIAGLRPSAKGSRLWSKLLRRQRSEGSRFKANPGKEFMKPYLKKNPSRTQKKAGGMAQGTGPEFKPQYRKKKKKSWAQWYVPVNPSSQAPKLHGRLRSEGSNSKPAWAKEFVRCQT
jgi:hypothetical protein